MKEQVRTKAAEYMSRAEKLKQWLNEAENKSSGKKPGAMGANGKASGGYVV